MPVSQQNSEVWRNIETSKTMRNCYPVIAHVLTTLAWRKPLQDEMHAKLNTQTFIPPDNSSTSQDTICPETNINSHKCQPRLKKINK